MRVGLFRLRSFVSPQALLLPLFLSAPGAPVAAQTPDPAIDLALPGQDLGPALLAFARVTGQQVFFDEALVAHHRAPAVQGHLTAGEALSKLLRGSGLHARRAGPNLWLLSADTPPAGRAHDDGAVASAADPAGRADPSGGEGRGVPPAVALSAVPDRDASPRASDEIVVTGSHIRGGGSGASPVTTMTRADVDRSGYATAAEALAAMPSNFAGMATEQSALSGADTSGANAVLATGVDLRALGTDATLVLVNGRRIAGSGLNGDIGDISSMPNVALDRVEVLTDGASALYGSDAVGGVVNILLKQRYDGAETRLRFGSVTSGGARETQLGQTLGTNWTGGGILAAYEYYHRGALASADRAFARSADSTPFGGTDHRYYLSAPGNILAFDPVTGAYGPAYAIRPGPSGTATTVGDFVAGATNLENLREGTDLTATQTRHSGYARLYQDVGDSVHLALDARYSRRDYAVAGVASSTVGEITAANPYFVSPDGAPYDLFAYSFYPELGPTRDTGTAEAMAYSASADVDLGAHWQIRSYAGFAQERDTSRADHLVDSASLSEALGTTPDDPLTPFSTAADGYFNPYGAGGANSRAILDFVGNGYTLSHIRTRVITGTIDADGPLFALPGGEVRLAVGANVRHEELFSSTTNKLFTDVPTTGAPIDAGRTLEAGYVELEMPLFGTPNARPGLRRLDLSAAVRTEHYADFGTATNPKLGLTWSPTQSAQFRSTFGTSFRAPNLRELDDRFSVSETTLARADGLQTIVLQLGGGNRDLKPEKATSWTVGGDLTPVAVPGLRLSATYFHTNFSRRIATPAADNFANALIDPSLSPFVQFVSPATNAADLAKLEAYLNSPAAVGSAPYPATTIGAIVDTRYGNTGRTVVSGLDADMSYGRDVGASHVTLAASATYLFTYRQTPTPTSAPVDQLELAGHPVDFRGRASLGWSRGPVDASVAVNHAAPYHDLVGKRIASWNTVDLAAGYHWGATSGPLHGLALTVTARNLLDTAPPFYDSTMGTGYDAANADATGRFVALQISKRW